MMMIFTRITDLSLLAREICPLKTSGFELVLQTTQTQTGQRLNTHNCMFMHVYMYMCVFGEFVLFGGGGGRYLMSFLLPAFVFLTWCMKCTCLGLICNRAHYDTTSSVVNLDFFPHFLTGAMWHHKPGQQRSVLQSCSQAAHRSLRA